MNAYEVFGDGIQTSIIARGRIIYGKSPADALRRNGIPFKKRIIERTRFFDYPPYGSPSKWIVVHHVNFSEEGNPYHAAGFPFIGYEV